MALLYFGPPFLTTDIVVKAKESTTKLLVNVTSVQFDLYSHELSSTLPEYAEGSLMFRMSVTVLNFLTTHHFLKIFLIPNLSQMSLKHKNSNSN